MRNVNLSKYNVRTDLASDIIKNIKYTHNDKDIKVAKIKLNQKESKRINKTKGNYITIHFNDITDNTNYENVLTVLIKELKNLLKENKIKKEHSCMIIGLGNEKSTADALGSLSAKKVIVTSHINKIIGSLEKGFRITTCFIPNVMGNTGMETSDVIEAILKKEKPKFIIIIDALASSSLDNLLKTIQLTDSGISPGSGIGNKRKEISKRVYKIPVIVIGVPTVVESSVIIKDVLDNLKMINEEEKEILLNSLYNQKNNLIVTPKDIDFLVIRLSNLISEAINKTIHNKSTKNI